MTAYVALNERALHAFDVLEAGGVPAPTRSAEPFLACFRTDTDRRALLAELTEMDSVGQKVDVEVLDGTEARRREPVLTGEVGRRSSCTVSGSSTPRGSSERSQSPCRSAAPASASA
jgi:D-amino-acid dehydrogenase